jgi:SAM-dependent methyltransferase
MTASGRPGVAAHLGIRLGEYDARIRTFIPRYEEMLDAAAAALRALRRGGPVIVDLGTGSGALAARCRAVVPRARFVGIDSDEGMLGLARSRLGAHLTAVTGDFLRTPLPPCDAITASFALHHVRTRRRKAALYARCHAALRPGGLLINADCCTASHPRLRSRDRAAWQAHLERAYTRRRAAAFLRAWASEDVYFTLEEEIALLRSAGFAVDVPWRRDSFAVVVAAKQKDRPDRATHAR